MTFAAEYDARRRAHNIEFSRRLRSAEVSATDRLEVSRSSREDLQIARAQETSFWSARELRAIDAWRKAEFVRQTSLGGIAVGWQMDLEVPGGPISAGSIRWVYTASGKERFNDLRAVERVIRADMPKNRGRVSFSAVVETADGDLWTYPGRMPMTVLVD